MMLKVYKWSVCLLVALLVAGGVTLASAQLTRGFISGTVSDSTGAIVAGRTSSRSLAAAAIRTTTSNGGAVAAQYAGSFGSLFLFVIVRTDFRPAVPRLATRLAAAGISRAQQGGVC